MMITAMVRYRLSRDLQCPWYCKAASPLPVSPWPHHSNVLISTSVIQLFLSFKKIVSDTIFIKIVSDISYKHILTLGF